MTRFARRRTWLAREVVQVSAMDCGPAALKSLLEGFHIRVSYPRLQEACQTDFDGTSINTIERLATGFGLSAQQVMLPTDCILLSTARALPAVVVVNREGMTHFLVAWRRSGAMVQLMDPSTGRRWTSAEAFRRELYIHRHRVPAAAWRSWAGSSEHCETLAERLQHLRATPAKIEQLVAAAGSDSAWRGFAVLDAAIRMATDLCSTESMRRGREAVSLIETIARRAGDIRTVQRLVPPAYWSVWPEASIAAPEHLQLRGAVLLRVRDADVPTVDRAAAQASASPHEVVDQLRETTPHPLRQAWQLTRDARGWPTALLAGAVLIGAIGAVAETLLLRGLIESGQVLSLREHRVIALLLILGVVATLLWIDLTVLRGLLRLGRRIEVMLRTAVLEKLPRISDRFISSRVRADLAARAHSLDALHALPELCARAIRSSTQLFFTALGLAWLNPAGSWIAGLAAAAAVALPLASTRLVGERELRQRIHRAALSRHYLDALMGLVAARTHGAERALRMQHETLLVSWAGAGIRLLRSTATLEALQLLIGSVFAGWIVVDFVARGGPSGAALLLTYWALMLPMVGREVAATIRQLPAHRNIVARVLELINAPEDSTVQLASKPAAAILAPVNATGVAVSLSAVDVKLAGRQVLRNLSVSISPGEHVAIVGRSGAGKSTFAGLLLGIREPSSGLVMVDDAPLNDVNLERIRRRTAWVDPSVQLWNRSLLDNLRYGESIDVERIGRIVQTADLVNVIETLPEGLQSPIGEGGGLTSGGEGQRVRFGRALSKRSPRLVVLDEPFRGLDRTQRGELLGAGRRTWSDATLFCITHTIEETLSFERVLVFEDGQIVEDGNPRDLAQAPQSRYATLLAADGAAGRIWEHGWRHWQIERGGLVERTVVEDGLISESTGAAASVGSNSVNVA